MREQTEERSKVLVSARNLWDRLQRRLGGRGLLLRCSRSAEERSYFGSFYLIDRARAEVSESDVDLGDLVVREGVLRPWEVLGE